MPIKVRQSGAWVQVSDGSDGASSFVTGMILMFSGTSIPTGFALCDGSNNTPDLRSRFIIGAESASKTGVTEQAGPNFNAANGGLGNATYEPGDVGGNVSHALTEAELGSHDHSIGDHTHSVGDHTHNIGNHSHNIGSHTHNIGNHTHSDGNYTASGGSHNHAYIRGNFNTDHDGNGNSIPLMGQAQAVNVSGNGTHNHNISGNSGNPNSTSSDTGNPNNTNSNTGNPNNIGDNTGNPNSSNDNTGNPIGNTSNTGNAGSGQYHENRPPYYALCFIMKT